MNTLGPGFNTGGADGASISPDGRYQFWRRYDGGQANIYWVANPFYVVSEPATVIHIGFAAISLFCATAARAAIRATRNNQRDYKDGGAVDLMRKHTPPLHCGLE
jgi:hypothetical protein